MAVLLGVVGLLGVLAAGPVGATPRPTPARTPVETSAYVVVDGDPLPRSDLAGTASDPAIGRKVPKLSGTALDGTKVVVGSTTRPRIVLAVAHWCSHCAEMVPMVTGLVRDKKLTGVDVQIVSSSASSSRSNYPPSAWFTREGWKQPVLADDAQSSAVTALGVSQFSFFVLVQPNGKVAGRLAPDVTATALLDHVKDLKAGRPLFR